MSRTRNTITMARGTIAENARRQLSLINRCQMPQSVPDAEKREERLALHGSQNLKPSGFGPESRKRERTVKTNHIFQQSELRRAG